MSTFTRISAAMAILAIGALAAPVANAGMISSARVSEFCAESGPGKYVVAFTLDSGWIVKGNADCDAVTFHFLGLYTPTRPHA